MTLGELRRRVTERFGSHLEGADADSLADFLLTLQAELPGTQAGGVVCLDGAPGSYTQAMREYFAGMLYAEADRAAASLWVTAVEMWLEALRETEAPGGSA
jgi:hypothetical protein